MKWGKSVILARKIINANVAIVRLAERKLSILSTYIHREKKTKITKIQLNGKDKKYVKNKKLIISFRIVRITCKT